MKSPVNSSRACLVCNVIDGAEYKIHKIGSKRTLGGKVFIMVHRFIAKPRIYPRFQEHVSTARVDVIPATRGMLLFTFKVDPCTAQGVGFT